MAAVLSPTRGALRVLRGTGLAITSASLSVAAHATSGGSLPDPATTALVTALLAGAGIALAHRRRGFIGITACLAISQLALHAFLQLAVTHAHGAPAAERPFNPLTMLVAHAAAGVVTAILLARAEAAIFAVTRFLAWALPRALTAPLPVTAPRAVCIPAVHIKVVAHFIHQRIHALRGPPQFSC